MRQFLFIVLIYVILFDIGDCLPRRNSFQGRLRLCKRLCGFRGASSGVSIQTCLQLRSQNNVTVSECVAGCLERKGESLTNAVECQCRFSNCIQQTNNQAGTQNGNNQSSNSNGNNASGNQNGNNQGGNPVNPVDNNSGSNSANPVNPANNNAGDNSANPANNNAGGNSANPADAASNNAGGNSANSADAANNNAGGNATNPANNNNNAGGNSDNSANTAG